jgi:long-subunit acyl-CoA synthetase (AMP-forming)
VLASAAPGAGWDQGLSDLLWRGDRRDQEALARRHDWSALASLERLWPQLADRHGDRLALEAPHARPPEQYTYAQLAAAIEQVAAAFASLGLAAGEVVALLADNSPRWLLADQGLMRLGAADAVTGSRHLVTLGDQRILLDCGLPLVLPSRRSLPFFSQALLNLLARRP